MQGPAIILAMPPEPIADPLGARLSRDGLRAELCDMLKPFVALADADLTEQEFFHAVADRIRAEIDRPDNMIGGDLPKPGEIRARFQLIASAAVLLRRHIEAGGDPGWALVLIDAIASAAREAI